MSSIFWVGMGGFIGATGRYAVSRLQFTKKNNFPWATFIVNALGSLILGFLYGLNHNFNLIDNNVMYFLGGGIMGSFTTFSTFSLESLQLYKSGRMMLFTLYVLSSVVLCLFCATTGFLLAPFFASTGN
ncbi:CrcB protein [Desulfohalotomaculum tongense]|uniref:fluoride efflux transporter CrcB n=1 Tax=Desulforadius tongensis TaxID=1216062 RepID=UPI00195DEE5A|nr:fluoride efflux transporter CrcB [Desulforadius tongensis]MBM7855000.1 CrcB protein [Desulforadius tongensis]